MYRIFVCHLDYRLRVCSLFAGMIAMGVFAGCGGGSNVGTSENNSQANAKSELDSELSGQEILGRVAESYRTANTYVDRGEFVLGYHLEGQPRQEKHPFELAFRKPNELHLRAFNTSLMGDGVELAFAVNDPETGHMDQQIIVQNATNPLNLGSIFRDPIASYFAAGGTEIPLAPQVEQPHIELMHPALALLTDHTDPAWFGRADKAKRLDDAKHRGELLYRVQIDSPNGKYLVWVEPRDWLIRRLDFPVKLLDPELSEAPQVARLEMYVDLASSKRDEALNRDSFRFDLPSTAKRLTQFVSLPEPFPSMLVGDVPRRFELPLIGNRNFQSSDLQGKTTAMLWFSSDPVCESVVRQFGGIRSQMSGIAGVQLIAVNTEPENQISDVRLLDLVQRWNCQEWVARADQAVGRDVFDIRALPTVVLFDDQGVVQFYKTIEDGDLATGLVAALERVAAGENLATEMKQEYDRYLEQYQAQLAELRFDRRQSGPSGTGNQGNSGSLSFVTEFVAPQRLGLKRAWEQDGLQAPGNIFVDGTNGLVVMDGYRSIVELDQNGNLQGRTTLQLSPGDAVTFLRSRPGQRESSVRTKWYAASLLGQRVFGLNRNWEVVKTWPPQGTTHHAGIREVVPSSRAGQDELILAFWQGKGLERWDSSGRISHQQPNLEQLNSFVPIGSFAGVQPASTQYAVASNDGVIRLLDQEFQVTRSISIPNHTVTHLFAAGAKNEEIKELLAIAPIDEDNLAILGLNANFEVAWRATIPAGQFTYPIEFVKSASLANANSQPNNQRVWLVARPNGMLYAFAEGGSWQDQFSVGVVPQGMTIVSDGDSARLVVSHVGGVSAWDLTIGTRVSSQQRETR